MSNTTISNKIDDLSAVAALAAHELVYRPLHELMPYPGNARVHDEKQLAAMMASISEFGFTNPILMNEEGMILSGHGRFEAAKRLRLETVPTRMIGGLTKAQQRAYVIADNKISQLSSWNEEQLKIEMDLLIQDDFDIQLTGFSTAEIDDVLDVVSTPEARDPDDLQPEDISETIVSKSGDLWILGKHRLLCGDSLQPESYARLMEGKKAQLVITDPPYNVPIHGHVCGSGKTRHDEFAMATGEMTPQEFTTFLKTFFTHTAGCMQDGAIIYSFMDWRHQRELLDAAEPIFGRLRQLCVWAKDNGGMGTFYRSQHELVFLFRKGDKTHINNFGLGQHGRYRTNVWQYSGVNTFKGKGYELLKLHPTVKPVGMIADAIRDCSHRNGLILDPFAGSGTILIAAERTGRYGRAIEFEPKYVDVAIRRWERMTGKLAVHDQSGLTHSELAEIRANEGDSHE